jgi:hypothetical protein
MDAVLEPQATPEATQPASAAEKKSFLKRLPKKALYGALALFIAIVLALGYTQHWFEGGAGKAKEMLSSVMPAASEKAPMAAPEAAPVATVASADDVLTKARQAFAAGDVQGSINGYKELLAKDPDNVNAMGELGNVLYTTGWIPQATQTYFEAASKALDQNKPEVAETLLPVIMQSNPMLASQLQDRMFEMESNRMDAEMDAQMTEGQYGQDAQPQTQPQLQAPAAPPQHG